jgi:divalent metal cation (Fe/Co/Zn/Cd) transporter
LDSSIEVFASLVVIWHMRGDAGGSDHRRARRSRRALRLMAAAFVILGLYLATNAVYAIVNANEPSTSPIGATFMAATVVVMFVLATAKRRVGRRLGNRPLLGNARMTFLDGCLAAGVCSALVADLALGWWWLDPVAAAVVAVLATGEGIKGWNEAADVTR